MDYYAIVHSLFTGPQPAICGVIKASLMQSMWQCIVEVTVIKTGQHIRLEVEGGNKESALKWGCRLLWEQLEEEAAECPRQLEKDATVLELQSAVMFAEERRAAREYGMAKQNGAHDKLFAAIGERTGKNTTNVMFTAICIKDECFGVVGFRVVAGQLLQSMSSEFKTANEVNTFIEGMRAMGTVELIGWGSQTEKVHDGQLLFWNGDEGFKSLDEAVELYGVGSCLESIVGGPAVREATLIGEMIASYVRGYWIAQGIED